MIRLGYLVPEFPSQTHAFFWREVQALRALGAIVNLISTRRPDAIASAHAFTDEARAQTHYLYPPRLSSLATLLSQGPSLGRALRYLRGLSERSAKARVKQVGLLACAVDLAAYCKRAGIEHVHVHSCADAAHVVALAHELVGISFSVSVHGDLPVYGTDHASKFKRAAAVVPVTSPLRDSVIALNAVNPDRVHVVTMGVDVDRFTPKPPTETGPQPLRVVSIARLNEVKGHVFLLAALARLRQRGIALAATFAGEGPHRAAIEAKIRELDLADAVTLAGTLGEQAVHRLLQAADIFALTSFGKGEAAPVSVMEAMSCSVPVISSRIGGTADMIEDGVDGLLVEQKDVEGIANAILALTDAEVRSRIGAAGRSRAIRSFDYRATAGRLLEVITNGRARDAGEPDGRSPVLPGPAV